MNRENLIRGKLVFVYEVDSQTGLNQRIDRFIQSMGRVVLSRVFDLASASILMGFVIALGSSQFEISPVESEL